MIDSLFLSQPINTSSFGGEEGGNENQVWLCELSATVILVYVRKKTYLCGSFFIKH